MDKPISIAIRDFRVNVEKTIVESGLPASVIEPIMKQYAATVEALAREELKRDMEKEEDHGE